MVQKATAGVSASRLEKLYVLYSSPSSVTSTEAGGAILEEEEDS